MELAAVVLAIVLSAMAGFLSVLAFLASRRFVERRFTLVALAFALVSAMAFLALIAELEVLDVRWFDEAFALEPVPLATLLIALILIYAAMVSPRRAIGSSGHGGA